MPWGRRRAIIFRVEPGGKTQVFRLALGQEALEKRLGAMLAPFRKSVLRREDLSRFSVSDAASLYQEILAPALSGVNPGTRLIIVPDGALGAFPFEALVVKAGPDWGKCTLVGDQLAGNLFSIRRHPGPEPPPGGVPRGSSSLCPGGLHLRPRIAAAIWPIRQARRRRGNSSMRGRRRP